MPAYQRTGFQSPDISPCVYAVNDVFAHFDWQDFPHVRRRDVGLFKSKTMYKYVQETIDRVPEAGTRRQQPTKDTNETWSMYDNT